MGQKITLAMAEDMLVEDIAPIERLLNGLRINFLQEQFDALVSWLFNLREGRFRGSTMHQRIIGNAGDKEITDQMVKWVNSAGRPLPGLMKRRVTEANLFIGYERYKVNKDRIIKV